MRGIITLYACVWACLKNEASHDTVQDPLRGMRRLEHYLPCHFCESMQRNQDGYSVMWSSMVYRHSCWACQAVSISRLHTTLECDRR